VSGMGRHKSFTKIEREIQHGYRKNLNTADSTEDIEKFFVYAVLDLIEQVFEGRVLASFEDISLDGQAASGYHLSPYLMANREFARTYKNSDISQVLERLAESADNHVKHLDEKHPDRTEAKIYPVPSHAGNFHKKAPQAKGPGSSH